VSTGFAIDWRQRPEFADLAPHVRIWSDRFVPEAGAEDQELSDSPDLGPLLRPPTPKPACGPWQTRPEIPMTTANDTIDRLAGLTDQSPVFATRRQRDKVA
ncbi:hypothetical protein MUQ23_10425, partial [Streptococcus suis]|nr:hypothetical protein [Streptococcus suis]